MTSATIPIVYISSHNSELSKYGYVPIIPIFVREHEVHAGPKDYFVVVVVVVVICGSI
jgi:hypothetical protein